MKKNFVLVLFLSIILYSYSQDYPKIDSLKKIYSDLPELKGTDDDTVRIMLGVELLKEYLYVHPDTALIYAESLLPESFVMEELVKTPALTLQILDALKYKGIIYDIYQRYNEVISLASKGLEIAENITDTLSIAKFNLQIGNAYMQLERYYDAIQHLIIAKNILIEIESEKEYLAICCANLGLSYWYQSNFPEALKSIEIAIKTDIELDDLYGQAIDYNTLGNVLKSQGNFAESLKNYFISLEIAEQIHSLPLKLIATGNIGNIYQLTGKYESAVEYFNKSMEICEEVDYLQGMASNHNNLGIIYYKNQDYEKSYSHLIKALEISESEELYFIRNSALSNLGVLMLHKNDIETAINYLTKSIKYQKEAGDFANLAADYPHLAKAYLKSGEPQKAVEVYHNVLDLTLKLIKSNFTVLSESDKEEYLKITQNVFNEMHELSLITGEKDLVGVCYDNELIVKGLLLNSTKVIQDAISSINDTAVVNTYYRMMDLRKQINEKQGILSDVIDDELEELEQRANEEERKLVRFSSDYAETQKIFEYKWNDVQKGLKQNEAAIEFIEIKHSLLRSDTCIKDSITYAALLLRYDGEEPVMIEICCADSIETLFKAGGIEASASEPDRGILFKGRIIDFEKAYLLIWENIENYLTGINSIVIAPVGYLNRIAFAALLCPDGSLLSDKYEIRNVISTRVIADNTTKSDKNLKTSVLFGGVDYQNDNSYAEALAEWYSYDKDVILQDLIKLRSANAKNFWKYLPGTLDEIEGIKDILGKRKILISSFTDSKALEERFKAMHFKSPDIIHIATHGFSIPMEQGINSYKIFENSFVQNYNPLFRTGLLFAGSARTWNKAEKIQVIEDGILTAYEVANMNLRNTELVVLSACETGLGDVKGSEGVYGLQRAFKIAGVRYIIASLWHVPDKETGEFMENFYKFLLKNNDVSKAFYKTQKNMSKKYDSYYWAAFVLIE
jgi:CHAT domain-containing protein